MHYYEGLSSKGYLSTECEEYSAAGEELEAARPQSTGRTTDLLLNQFRVHLVLVVYGVWHIAS
jgi:hypothetical protein